ncbi:hypothetical protein JCM8547_002471 [Rhodosporidiobolus lusitaniae]
MATAPLLTFPPSAVSAAHARLTYAREDSLSPSRASSSSAGVPQRGRRFSHSRGRPPTTTLGGSSLSRERSVSTSGRSEWTMSEGGLGAERGRSLSSVRGKGEGSEGSRAPLCRRGVSVSRTRSGRAQVEKGEKREEVEEEKDAWVVRLGRHMVGVRGERALPTPLLPFLRHLPVSVETPLLTFLGTLPSILLCCAISASLSQYHGFEDTPLTVGSLGATAVLLYAVPEGPLSQPRNLVGGHTISAVIGCVISQLFSFSPLFSSSPSLDNEIAIASSWTSLAPVAASLSVSSSVLAMQLTGTVHPPGGATALIAAYHRTNAARWTYLLVVFLSVVVMGVWALFVNNLGRRRYPAYWWFPPPPDSPPSSGAPAHPQPSSPPLSVTGKPGAEEHIEHTSAHPSHPPSISPNRDLQQRWLGRLGEEDEGALAGVGEVHLEGGTGEEEEEERRGRERGRRY